MGEPALHSALGASSAERWMNCPGSVREAVGMPNESSVYAREGSCAHALAEMCLTEKLDPFDYLGEDIKGFEDIEVDEEMVDGVRQYIETIQAAIQEYEDAGHTDWELSVEQRFDLSTIHPSMFGTGDAVLFLPAWKRLIVFDFKYGYIGVAVAHNKQAKYYAVGALITRYHNRGVDSVELVIVQPRDGKHTAPKRWECDPLELLEFVGELKEAAAATEQENAALKAGAWCKYCPASPKCKTLARLVEEAALTEMGDFCMPRKPEAMTEDELKLAWQNAAIIEAWAKNIKAYAHHRSINGNMLQGCKLVEGKAHRKWRDEEEARAVLQGLVALEEIEGDIEKTKLKSPKQIETMLGSKKKDRIKNLWVKGQGSLSLVPIDDDRPSAKADVLEEFA